MVFILDSNITWKDAFQKYGRNVNILWSITMMIIENDLMNILTKIGYIYLHYLADKKMFGQMY